MARSTTLALVRCLDCGTEYHLTPQDGGADPCPHCGGVGWILVDDRRNEKTS